MFLLIGFCSFITATSSSKLLSAVVIHRHGDRNPFTTYKTDPYKDESNWPEGFGQLTKIGIQRQYDLGVWLRNRYDTLLPSRYSPKNVKATSTDVDRTLMSAEVTLAGLFPPSEADKFNENINWQPIPIHTTPPKDDALLAMKKFCKKYQQLFDDLLNSDHVKEINEMNKELYDFLSEKTGENITDVYDVEAIYNTLNTHYLANKTLPQWAWEVYPDNVMMKAAVSLRFKLPCYNRELAHLKTGLLFGEIVKLFQDFVDELGKSPKLLLFSGHDSTLADVLTTMGTFNDEVPSYSSAILLELYLNDGDHYVNILFKNSTGVYNLTLEGCDFNCDFANFTRFFEPIVQPNQTQWEKECENV
jgi:lysosomal acid phosphatase